MKRENVTRVGAHPVDFTLETGEVFTLQAHPGGRFRVLVTTPNPAKVKRRKARTDPNKVDIPPKNP
jgi:hypothetical protein